MTLARVERLVRGRIGLDPGSLGATLPRLVAERMAACRLSSADAYAGLAAADPAEWAALVAGLVVPETWFFRGSRPLFDHLAGWVRDRSGAKPVRVLCVPCSTGEEPYSLAIAFAEAGVGPAAARIDAVDLSDDHLRRAEAGRFGASSFREGGPDPRPKWFTPAGPNEWTIAPRAREWVRFRAGNLADPAFLADEPPYDLVMCRNVLIYLTADATARAVGHLDRLLAPGGLLCITPAEADNLPAEHFAPAGPDGMCLYRKASRTKDAARPAAGRVSAIGPAVALASGGRVSTGSPDQPGGSRPPLAKTLAERTRDAAPVVLPADPETAARSLADAGRLDEARAAAERALAAAPSAGLFSLLGVVHAAAGRTADAAGAFRKALYLDPNQPEALAHMAVLADRRGDSGAAAGFRRRLARLSPEAPA
ncbi:MAG: hypothetical protein K2X82_04945 [Gemmataceae bacterium]|nr:hypothetical protein [Gemmataceae bacterium]